VARRGDAVEGVDYDLDNLTKVWTQTNAQDQSLAEGAYRGICSGGYMPGPLADEEYLVKQIPLLVQRSTHRNPGVLMPKIVIIGAGIVGCSLADELTERGYCDVVVIEKGKLWKPGGSTSHAPGVVFQTNGSRTMAQFARQTVEKLYGLRYGGETCFLKVGSLEIATTPERLADLHRRAGLAMSAGINARVITPEEALKLHPLLVRDKLLGALYVPDDGIARAILADEVMGERSISRGARFIADLRGPCHRSERRSRHRCSNDTGIIPGGYRCFLRWNMGTEDWSDGGHVEGYTAVGAPALLYGSLCLNWPLTRVKLNCPCSVTRVLTFISGREDKVLRLAGTATDHFL
jgi:hypothetical protein